MRGLLLLLFAINSLSGAPPFVVRVVDDKTGRGVPLVELRALNHVTFVTDSAGIAAIDDPVFTGKRVLFEVSSHGYEYQGRVFGNKAQVMLTLIAGGRQELKIHRTNIAERLYRLTGAGIYQDSVAAGMRAPILQPMLNAGVLGQDTADAIVYRNRIFWIWGDTFLPGGYNFSVSGATSRLPGNSGGLDPSVGVDYDYFVNDEGMSRPMLPLKEKGLVWIEGLFKVRDPQGEERLMATYTRQQGLTPPDECGVALFDDSRQVFAPELATQCVHGHVSSHPFLHRVDGREYWYFYPLHRVPNDWAAIHDPKQWEAFTCLQDGAVLDRKNPQFDRDPQGQLRWQWRKGAARFDAREERGLLADGRMKPEEARFPLIEAGTGKPSLASASSVLYSDYRKRWILLAERGGDVFYSEADRPEGPWLKAVRIVHHDNYTFYNVVMHPFFMVDYPLGIDIFSSQARRQVGRIVYFEGTYTDSFSNTKRVTPRYNYNQIMYRFDLADARLNVVR